MQKVVLFLWHYRNTSTQKCKNSRFYVWRNFDCNIFINCSISIELSLHTIQNKKLNITFYAIILLNLTDWLWNWFTFRKKATQPNQTKWDCRLICFPTTRVISLNAHFVCLPTAILMVIYHQLDYFILYMLQIRTRGDK